MTDFYKQNILLNNERMPKPNPGESEKEYLKRCIPELIREGREQRASIAICYSMYRREGTEAKSPKPEKSSSHDSSNHERRRELAAYYCYICDY